MHKGFNSTFCFFVIKYWWSWPSPEDFFCLTVVSFVLNNLIQNILIISGTVLKGNKSRPRVSKYTVKTDKGS